MNLNKYIIMDMLQDMEDFAQFKHLECSPIYILGGSGAILGGYIDRGTTDIDILDLDYSSSVGRLFRLLGQLDYLDIYLTTIAYGYEQRATRINQFEYLNIYILSKEDIITTKLGRYSQKDKEDISAIWNNCNHKLVIDLIEQIKKRTDISKIVKAKFIENVEVFGGDYHL